MSMRLGMVNRPDTADIISLPPGVSKVQWIPDTRFPLSGICVIHLEDHMMGNLLRAQLSRDPRVEFVGYRIPHPLQTQLEIRIHTKVETPFQCIQDALRALDREVQELKSAFMASCHTFTSQKNAPYAMLK